MLLTLDMFDAVRGRHDFSEDVGEVSSSPDESEEGKTIHLHTHKYSYAKLYVYILNVI